VTIGPRKHKRKTPSQAFTRSKQIYHIGRSLKFCGTVHCTDLRIRGNEAEKYYPYRCCCRRQVLEQYMCSLSTCRKGEGLCNKTILLSNSIKLIKTYFYFTKFRTEIRTHGKTGLFVFITTIGSFRCYLHCIFLLAEYEI